MTSTIVVAGASGNLGGRIIASLLGRGAAVRALVRADSDKTAALASRGVKVAKVDMTRAADVAAACAGATCIVSALQGLRDVIVDTQSVLLEGALAAGVPRFIPSDYSLDFTKLTEGENRNLDFRRAFHARLDVASIAATSILNGAFTELLVSRMPLLNLGARRVGYFGDPDQQMDFTTMDDIAAYTAAASLDDTTPRVLRIAGDQISARGLAAVAGEVTGAPFELVRMGSLDDLAATIVRDRAADPKSEGEAYPRWQGAQYMHNMFSGRGKLAPLDNDRYPGMHWTTVRDVIAAAAKK